MAEHLTIFSSPSRGELKWRSALAVSFILFFILCPLTSACAQGANAPLSTPRSLSVSGTGEVHATPDQVTVTLGVSTDGKTVQQAVRANNDAMSRVLALLKKEGVPEKNIRTSGLNLQPIYHYSNGPDRKETLTGYRFDNTVTATLTDIDTLGELLDTVTQQGANRLQGIQYGLQDDSKLMDEARKLAVKDALRKAQVYADAGNFTLGRILQLDAMENGASPIPPRPMAMRMKAEAFDASVPVAGGEETVRTDVQLVVEIE